MSTTTRRVVMAPKAGGWGLAGSLLGISAGGIFLIFEMTVAGNVGPSAFGPLRMISAMVLGEGALPGQPTMNLPIVVPVSLVVHFALSAVYGAAFGTVARSIGALKGSRRALVGAATAFGFALWIVNFYVIAPVLFPWFGMANPVVQFIAHTFFFGTTLGLMLAQRLRKDSQPR
jgi:hypothetical protein